MMRVFLACALLLCVLGVEASLKDSLMADSHKCCVSSCTSQEKELLERRVLAYEIEGAKDAHEVRRYHDLAASGDACRSGNGKRDASQGSSNVTVVSTGSFDVQYASITITYNISLYIPQGIYYAVTYVTIYINNSLSSTLYPTNYYYSDPYGNATTRLVKTLSVVLPRYALAGTWTITSYGYSLNYVNYVTGSAYFVVPLTVNDMSPPVLSSLNASVWNLNDNTDRSISFSATDNLSGVRNIQIYIGNSTYGTVLYGSYYVPYVNGQYIGQLSVASAFTSLYNYTALYAGTYDIQYVYLYDTLGLSAYYSQAQLAALGIQNQITVAAGNCPAGRKLAYGATGQCTLCDKGTFSGAGAFRCKACLPGTASNVAGATSCTTCPPGTASIGGSAGCDICPAGTISPYSGAAECQPSYPGTNSTDGSQYGTSCPAGTYSLGGAALCSACPPGTASSGGSFACDPCIPGTYMPGWGASSCLLVPAGTYSWIGFSVPTLCPANTPNGSPGSNSRLNCY